jgi:hypothetical protein
MRGIDIRNKDLFVPFVSDPALAGVNECAKRDAKKNSDTELFHPFGVLTLGKRAFLIKRFRFFPSVDIR